MRPLRHQSCLPNQVSYDKLRGDFLAFTDLCKNFRLKYNGLGY